MAFPTCAMCESARIDAVKVLNISNNWARRCSWLRLTRSQLFWLIHREKKSMSYDDSFFIQSKFYYALHSKTGYQRYKRDFPTCFFLIMTTKQRKRNFHTQFSPDIFHPSSSISLHMWEIAYLLNIRKRFSLQLESDGWKWESYRNEIEMKNKFSHRRSQKRARNAKVLLWKMKNWNLAQRWTAKRIARLLIQRGIQSEKKREEVSIN